MKIKKIAGNKSLASIDIILTTSVVALFFVVIFLSVNYSRAATIGEQFTSGNSVTIGSIVSLDAENQDEVKLSNTDNANYILGVAVDPNSNALNFEKYNGGVSVAFNGEVQVFVSDINGLIQKGDFVSASWLEGVGMKSLGNDRQRLLGVALEDYSAEEAKYYGAVNTPEGDKNVSVDSILLRILDKEGFSTSTDKKDGLEGVISRIAGKNVSFARVLAGSIVFVVCLGVAGVFIVSAIKNSFISIGRNPLSSNSILKSLVHVSGLSVSVILVGAALSYVVLVV